MNLTELQIAIERLDASGPSKTHALLWARNGLLQGAREVWASRGEVCVMVHESIWSFCGAEHVDCSPLPASGKEL